MHPARGEQEGDNKKGEYSAVKQEPHHEYFTVYKITVFFIAVSSENVIWNHYFF
jgi:hypothetical protein